MFKKKILFSFLFIFSLNSSDLQPMEEHKEESTENIQIPLNYLNHTISLIYYKIRQMITNNEEEIISALNFISLLQSDDSDSDGDEDLELISELFELAAAIIYERSILNLIDFYQNLFKEYTTMKGQDPKISFGKDKGKTLFFNFANQYKLDEKDYVMLLNILYYSIFQLDHKDYNLNLSKKEKSLVHKTIGKFILIDLKFIDVRKISKMSKSELIENFEKLFRKLQELNKELDLVFLIGPFKGEKFKIKQSNDG